MLRRWILPLAALLMLLVAGLLAERIGPFRGDGTSTVPEGPRPEIVYPRDRPKLRPPVAAPAPDARPELPPTPAVRPLDRFERAIGSGSGMIVAEVNAIRHSPIAEAILRCRGAEIDRARTELREETGLDLFEDVDRVMASEGNIVVSGNFADLEVPEDLDSSAYGDEARIFRPSSTEDEEGRFAIVGKDLIVMGPDASAVRAAVDRVEGRAPARLPAAIMDGGAEIFGPLDASLLEKLAAGSPAAGAVESVAGASFRAIVDEHVAVSLDFEAKSPEEAVKLEELVQGSLSALRMEAATRGDARLVELLRSSRVALEGSGLALDLPVPGPMILDLMDCDEEGRPRPD